MTSAHYAIDTNIKYLCLRLLFRIGQQHQHEIFSTMYASCVLSRKARKYYSCWCLCDRKFSSCGRAGAIEVKWNRRRMYLVSSNFFFFNRTIVQLPQPDPTTPPETDTQTGRGKEATSRRRPRFGRRPRVQPGMSISEGTSRLARDSARENPGDAEHWRFSSNSIFFSASPFSCPPFSTFDPFQGFRNPLHMPYKQILHIGAGRQLYKFL